MSTPRKKKVTLKGLIQQEREERDRKRFIEEKGKRAVVEQEKEKHRHSFLAVFQKAWPLVPEKGGKVVVTKFEVTVDYVITGNQELGALLDATEGCIRSDTSYSKNAVGITRAGKAYPNTVLVQVHLRRSNGYYTDRSEDLSVPETRLSLARELYDFADKVAGAFPEIKDHEILKDVALSLRQVARTHLLYVKAQLESVLVDLTEKEEVLDQRLHSLPSPLAALGRSMDPCSTS